MITYKKVSSPDAVVEAVSGRIIGALQAGKRVVWLVSGGSLVPLEVAVMDILADYECGGLAIVQADERYGDIGHADSNWQRLIAAGFTPGSAYAVPILAGLGVAETVQRYDELLHAVFDAKNVVGIGFFGIGTDGHTAGILPGSAALDSPDLVTGYEGPDFVRITVTPQAIAKLQVAIAYAAGEAKQSVIERLHDDVPAARQPAQLLKQAAETRIYHD